MWNPIGREKVEISCTGETMIHLSIFIAKKKKKKEEERTGWTFLFCKFFPREICASTVLHRSEAVYERNSWQLEWKLGRRAPNKVSSVRVRHALTERRVTLSRRIARKEEPIPSGAKSNEDRNTCYCFTLGDTYPINALTSRENDLLSIIIDF